MQWINNFSAKFLALIGLRAEADADRAFLHYKQTLSNRLQDHLKDLQNQLALPTPEPREVVEVEAEVNDVKTAESIQDEQPDYDSWKFQDLRAECKRIHGTYKRDWDKEELIDRLKN